MSSMTVNNVIQLFQNIVTSHLMLKGFGFGNLFEINGKIKPGLQYNLLWLVPLESQTTQQTKARRFLLLCVGKVHKNKDNRNEVWSDTEQILDDIVKILRNESDNYNLLNDPAYTPVDEEHADWVTGWQTEIVLETDFNSNFCDIPMNDMPPDTYENFARVVDQDGNLITRLYAGQTYSVEVLREIIDTIDGNESTIIDPIN